LLLRTDHYSCTVMQEHPSARRGSCSEVSLDDSFGFRHDRQICALLDFIKQFTQFNKEIVEGHSKEFAIDVPSGGSRCSDPSNDIDFHQIEVVRLLIHGSWTLALRARMSKNKSSFSSRLSPPANEYHLVADRSRKRRRISRPAPDS